MCIKRYKDHKLKNFKVICTDDNRKREFAWITLFYLNENIEKDQFFEVFEFQYPIPPTRFVRIVSTGELGVMIIILSFSISSSLKVTYSDIFIFY